MREILLPTGTEWVLAVDVPQMLALALHPRPPEAPDAESPDMDPVVLAGILRADAEDGHRKALRRAVLAGEVEVFDHARLPTSWGGHARVSIESLADYVAQFGVAVTVAPNEEPTETVTVVTTDEHRENAEASLLESVTGETKLQRAARRYDRFLALGGMLKKAGTAWHAAGERGAIAKLEREEKAAGAPRSDKSDLRRELHAEHERRIRPV
jgi:hypothetical protein